MDKRHFDHAAEIEGRFFVAGEEAAAFLQPADQSFYDVALTIAVLVEFHRTGLAILVRLRGDHGSDAHLEEHLVDPTGPVTLVASNRLRPGNQGAQTSSQLVVDAIEQIEEARVLMRLTSRKLEVQRASPGIADQVNFTGKTAPRTA